MAEALRVLEPLSDDQRWYAVQSHAKREHFARFQLRRQGFRAFLPAYMKTVRHARKTSMVSVPFFPGYLFVAFDSERDRWRSINGTIGVARLVTARERPVAVPAGVVESLVSQCDADGTLKLAKNLTVGQNIRVLNGPFADLFGQLIRIDGGERVQVLLSLLGGNVRVGINRHALMPAAP